MIGTVKKAHNDMAGTRPVLAWVGGGFLLWFYFAVLGSAFARLNLLLYEPEKETHQKNHQLRRLTPFSQCFPVICK